jgi:hypothetical protein
MGMKAAARYLRKLREKNVGTRPELQKKMKLSDNSILERIEKGDTEVRILAYFAFIYAVGARADHVAALLTNEDGAAADAAAESFIDEMLSGEDISTEIRQARRYDALAIAEQLAPYPEAFGRWLERGEQLLDGLGDKS